MSGGTAGLLPTRREDWQAGERIAAAVVAAKNF